MYTITNRAIAIHLTEFIYSSYYHLKSCFFSTSVEFDRISADISWADFRNICLQTKDENQPRI